MTDAEDSCTGDVCTCTVSGKNYEVQQGRVQLEESSAAAKGLIPGRRLPPVAGEGFGLHLVNCSTNIQPGGMTTAEVEAKFAEKLGNMTSYDAFMDYNVALLTTNLDSCMGSPSLFPALRSSPCLATFPLPSDMMTSPSHFEVANATKFPCSPCHPPTSL